MYYSTYLKFVKLTRAQQLFITEAIFFPWDLGQLKTLSNLIVRSTLLSEVVCEGRHPLQVVVVAGWLLPFEGSLHVLKSGSEDSVH